MNKLIIFSVSLAICGITAEESSTEQPRWRGPFANHPLGRNVIDTPEVMVAKQQHAKAYAKARAIVPELPPEIRFQPNPDPEILKKFIIPPQKFIPKIAIEQQIPVEERFVPADVIEKARMAVFAEEVPRSPIGEVPEVYLARIAHFDAYQKAAQIMPTEV